jgi:hypothetical protein
VQRCQSRGTQSRNASGIRRDFRFEQNNMHGQLMQLEKNLLSYSIFTGNNELGKCKRVNDRCATRIQHDSASFRDCAVVLTRFATQ